MRSSAISRACSCKQMHIYIHTGSCVCLHIKYDTKVRVLMKITALYGKTLNRMLHLFSPHVFIYLELYMSKAGASVPIVSRPHRIIIKYHTE